MNSFILLQIISGIIFAPLCSEGFQLVLDTTFSPPTPLPTDPTNMPYSSPAGDHNLLPILVHVQDLSGNAITDAVTVFATTIDTNNVGAANTGDTYDGELCIHRAYFSRFGWCRYIYDADARRTGIGTCAPELICDTTDVNYPKGKVNVTSVDGVATFPRLVHTTPALTAHRRVRFYAEYGPSSATVDSNEFEVHLAATGIEFVTPVGGNLGAITVNEPQTFTVKTVALNPSTGITGDLTTGRHSVLNIDLTVSWDSKRFYFFFPANFNLNQLYSSDFSLGGTDAMLNGRFDTVIRKQAASGQATFNDVRITSEGTNVRLNFTQTLPNNPWERRPPEYDSDIFSDKYDGVLVLWTETGNTTSNAVLLTPAFTVNAAAVDTLEITAESLAAFNPSMDANFPFDTPLVIRALDASGNLITDGPDANLAVTVSVDPSATCLSVDSAFSLTAGVGTYPGSICQPNVQNIRLKFTVTSAIGPGDKSTNWSPTFDVTGDFYIGGFFSLYADLLVTIMAQAAVELVNTGRSWEPEFHNSGRTLHLEKYYLQSTDIQETLRAYASVKAQNEDTTRPTIRALLGSSSDEDTIALSRVSQADKMPIMGYRVETADLSDKATHPYFGRVSFSAGARFEAEAAFLRSHYWDQVIAIKDSANPLPTVMYQGFEKFNIKIALEVTIPSLTTEPTDMSALPKLQDSVAQTIFDAGTKIIYSNVVVPTDIYLMREAMRLGFSPMDGYVWILNTLSQSGFPQTNERGECATAVPTCTTAFNSTIIIISGVDADVDDPVWTDNLHDAYQQLVDPTSVGGIMVFRWSSILGQQSQSHDAVLAILKGALTLIDNTETITADKLMPAIRSVNFTGGSGLISFDANGDRIGFSASVYNMFPVSDFPGHPNDIWYLASSWNVNPSTNEVDETQYPERIDRTGAYVPTEWAFPPHEYTNMRRVMAYDDTLGPGLHELTREVPVAYHCGDDGCGGGLGTENPDTLIYWNHGTCVSQDTCLCKSKNGTEDPGYAGTSCQQILCDPPCRNGECVNPDECQCEDKWSGADCGTPTCERCNLLYGNCTGPDVCTCIAGHFGYDCSKPCTCKNGQCSDGQTGNGACSSCDSGWAGANCDVSIPLVVVPTVILALGLLIGIIIFIIWYMRRMKFRAALANNDWMVDYGDVIIISEEKVAQSMGFRSTLSMAGDKQNQKEVARNQGKWNNQEVAIKLLNTDNVAVNMQQRLEIKDMRDIRHKNLAAFVGACVTAPNVCILMELGPKGSLDDLISNESINIDWNFKYSLLKDICRGMSYLATTPIKSHGRLKASNCVVDNRWTLKITDYGMWRFKADQLGVPKFNPLLGKQADVEDAIENSVKASLLYTAPEILRTGVSHPDHVGAGTIQGDMYSMSMIMVEMLTQEAPYHEYLDYVDVNDLLQALAGNASIASQLPPAWSEKGSGQLRPILPDDSDPAYGDLLQTMWVEDPLQRPSFSHVQKQLEALSPQRGDLMDNLVSMLEKYSTNLEGIVAERTRELAAEKEKTEDLLHRMLPKAIASKLTRGEKVAPESFDCVTIYFSDIVGFTAIAAESTPHQVVALLNALYTTFDEILDHYDVYKVETIGDAYMVVSGLPIRNGDQHAGEIASMSIHLLSAIGDFIIPHIQDKKIQLRIGLHSGPVVAGVVGLKMPRYCLFGDTVNTASRMESGGLALRIHLSETTADILQNKLQGYDLEIRGAREVKGKGMMTTYWLKGREGLNYALPSEAMAVSESQHEFK